MKKTRIEIDLTEATNHCSEDHWHCLVCHDIGESELDGSPPAGWAIQVMPDPDRPGAHVAEVFCSGHCLVGLPFALDTTGAAVGDPITALSVFEHISGMRIMALDPYRSPVTLRDAARRSQSYKRRASAEGAAAVRAAEELVRRSES